jgi:hypothetical protein
MALKVQDQSSEVTEMAAAWAISEALLGGTAAMRAGTTQWLPKWPNETQASYDTRVATATLFPALTRTVSVMTGKPFAKQITLGDDVPPKIVAWCDDADQQGNNLHSFSADVMAEALGYGICGVLVDYPTVAPEQARTLQDERSLGVRPYLVFVRHAQILGWKSVRVGGVTTLTQLRLAETKEVPDGEFGVKCVPRVRVLEPGRWSVYMPGAKAEDDWTLEEGGVTTLTEVPFVPFYGKKKGFMCGVSPLLDLAYLNVKHWQSQSDQDTLLHVARVPILVIIGGDEQAEFTVGASTAGKLNAGADMKFVEHTGAAIGAGEISLDKLEQQMIQTGAELLVQKPGGDKSATEANNEAEANKSDLQRIVESFEDSLDSVLQLMAMWVGEKQGGHASLFKDFGASTLTDASAQLVLNLQQAGLITKETALREQQRRGMLAADIVPEDELALVAEEGPALGDMGMDPLTGLPIEPEIDPVTGEPKPRAPGNVATSQPVDNSAPGGNVAAPAVDFAPLLDAIHALIDKPVAAVSDPVPMDLSPIVEAIKALQPPVVNVPASADITSALQAMVEAIRAMPAPVVNMPEVSINAPITVNVPEQAAPEITVPITVTPAQVLQPKSSSITFQTNGGGDITGASLT